VSSRSNAYAVASASAPAHGRRGFTLLEVMMAVVVLGTALVALTRMLALGRLAADTDAKRMVALRILRRETELVRAAGYQRVATQVAAAVPDEPGCSRAVAVASAGTGLKRVTVTVTWTSPTGATASESLEFMVADTPLPMRTMEAP
jgi:prepilin-type N-terminal cleavage/methylation domain-containing protein